MSIVSLETKQEQRYPHLEALREAAAKLRVPKEPMSEVMKAVAQDQGRDMIDHLTKFIGHEEDVFKRYFMVDNEYHVNMLMGFWDGVRTNYPNMLTLDSPDYPFQQQHTFPDVDAVLIEKRQYHPDSGELFGVNFEAEYLEDIEPEDTERSLGTLAVAHLD